MSRSLRIQYPGAIYHVTVRGNARQAIYADDADRRLFCSRMESSVEHAGLTRRDLARVARAWRRLGRQLPNQACQAGAGE